MSFLFTQKKLTCKTRYNPNHDNSCICYYYTNIRIIREFDVFTNKKDYCYPLKVL